MHRRGPVFTHSKRLLRIGTQLSDEVPTLPLMAVFSGVPCEPPGQIWAYVQVVPPRLAHIWPARSQVSVVGPSINHESPDGEAPGGDGGGGEGGGEGGGGEGGGDGGGGDGGGDGEVPDTNTAV